VAKSDFRSVDEYIASQPEGVQETLGRIRSTIRKAVPGAEEVISYGIPTYKLHGGPVLYFAAWKRHCSLYPATQRVVAAFHDELAAYEVHKGTIRFPLSQPVPLKLIGRIAKFRSKELAGGEAGAVTEIKAGLPIILFASAADWERWLSRQPRSSKGLWLKLGKKGAGAKTVLRQEAIDGALCHGWIDGQVQKFDDRYWLIRFTPRLARSKWSSINQARAQALIDTGRMNTAGLEEIERAKADGRWEAAYPPQSKAQVPQDLQAALDSNPKAKRFFSKLDGTNRYAILYRVHNAKKAEARASKIEKYVQMLARGETIYPLRSSRRAVLPGQ
jgi:uncharacterized protein YdeI (YjbR/CyaY-like superfamily)/uncharacterized protein YdhG (YjbR/CyaY superfamily)